MSSAKEGCFVLFLFVFLFIPFVLLRLQTVLYKSGKRGHPYFIPDLSVNEVFFYISYDGSNRFLI